MTRPAVGEFGSADPELRDELRALAAALRAHLEWQRATGAVGMPRETEESKAPAAVVADADWAPQLGPSPQPTEPPADALPSEPGTERPAPSLARAIVAEETSAESGPALGTSADPPGRSADSLADLQREVVACTACQLSATRTQTVFARGTGASRLCFVGEGPGADEDASGVPFVGAAGQLLDRMIVAMGLERDAVYVCNIVKCRPPNNRRPELDEMLACRPFLERQLSLVDPEVIVALGATAAQSLLGTNEGIKRLRGKWRLFRGQIAVMPTFHPAYLLRNAAAKREVWDDLQAVLRQMGRPAPSRR